MIQRFLPAAQLPFNQCSAGSPAGSLTPLQFSVSGPQPSFCRQGVTNTRGYTLVELVMVIILLGLIFGLVLPQFRTSAMRDSLDSTALRLIGLVEDLRGQAVSDQVVYLLHFDIRGKRVWFHAADATEEDRELAEKGAQRLPADVRIEDVWSWSRGRLYDEATILFSRKGYIEQAMIHLQADDGRQVSLEFTPFLGSVKIHDGYVDIDRG